MKTSATNGIAKMETVQQVIDRRKAQGLNLGRRCTDEWAQRLATDPNPFGFSALTLKRHNEDKALVEDASVGMPLIRNRSF